MPRDPEPLLLVEEHVPSRAPVAELLLVVAMTLQAALTFAIAWERHHRLLTTYMDGAFFQQLFYYVIHHGRPLFTVLPPDHGLVNAFAVHFCPIILVLTPLYALAPSLLTLQFVQSLLVASAAWPVYRAACRLGNTQIFASGWAGLFLISPYTLNGGAWDFHQVAFAVPLMAWGMVAVLERNARMLAICVVGLLLTKEHYGLALTGFSLWWMLRYRTWWPLPFAVLGVGIVYAVVFQIIPWLRAGQAISDDMFASRYQWMTGSLCHVATGIQAHFTAPVNNPFDYLANLFGLYGGLPLLALPLTLPAMADIAANMLSANLMPRGIMAYHSMPIMPVFAISAASVGGRFAHRLPAAARGVILASLYAINGLVLIEHGPWTMLTAPDGHALKIDYPCDADALDQAANAVLKDAALAAQDNIAAHFANRAQLGLFPNALEKADTVILHLEYPYTTPAQWFNLPLFYHQPEYRQAVQALLDGRAFGIVYWNDPWLVMRRGVKDADVLARLEAQEALERLYSPSLGPPSANCRSAPAASR